MLEPVSGGCLLSRPGGSNDANGLPVSLLAVIMNLNDLLAFLMLIRDESKIQLV